MLQHLAAAVLECAVCLVADDSGVAPGGIVGDSQSPSPLSGAEHRGLQRSETAPLTL